MKTSNWRLAAVLVNLAVIGLAYPNEGPIEILYKAEISNDQFPIDGARRSGIDVQLMTRNEDGSTHPNEARKHAVDVRENSDSEGHAGIEVAGRHSETASSRATNHNSAEGRSGSPATAMINFNLGGPLHIGGGYRDVNSGSVGAKHHSRGSVNALRGNGGGKGYINQENLGGIQQVPNRYSEMNIVDGHSGDSGGEKFDEGGNKGFPYNEPKVEHTSGGYGGGIDDHIESIHSVSNGDDYNNQDNIGGIVGASNGHGEIGTSEFVGVGGSKFGDKFKVGSGGRFDVVNSAGNKIFGYSENESEQNSLGSNEVIHRGQSGGSRGGEFNIAKVNGGPALVGGGAGGVYLSPASNEGSDNAQDFVEDSFSEGGYGKYADGGRALPTEDHSDTDVESGKVAGFYTPPDFIGINSFGSIIHPGILQAQFSPTDESGGYAGIIGSRDTGK